MKLTIVRVSIARIAQALEVDNHLGVTGKTYEELCEIAKEDSGWNDLAGWCVDKAVELQEGRP